MICKCREVYKVPVQSLAPHFGQSFLNGSRLFTRWSGAVVSPIEMNSITSKRPSSFKLGSFPLPTNHPPAIYQGVKLIELRYYRTTREAEPNVILASRGRRCPSGTCPLSGSPFLFMSTLELRDPGSARVHTLTKEV